MYIIVYIISICTVDNKFILYDVIFNSNSWLVFLCECWAYLLNICINMCAQLYNIAYTITGATVDVSIDILTIESG